MPAPCTLEVRDNIIKEALIDSSFCRHCEERGGEAIPGRLIFRDEIASFARNDEAMN